MTPKAVICDFGGVLTRPLREAFGAWQEHSGIDLALLGGAMASILERDGLHPLYELEMGLMTETAFFALVEAELGEGSMRDFRETYFEHLLPNPRMLEFMVELRDRGLRLGMLTNNIREWEPHWRPMVPDIGSLFEIVIDSAYVGMRKPDPQIYSLMLERMGDLTAADCIFIDDIAANCEAAAAGMTAVHFLETDQAIADVEAALAAERT